MEGGMNPNLPRDPRRRRGFVLAAAGAVSAVVLALGISGTLSSWTEAVLGNDDNHADSATSVVLEETGPGATTCTTSGTASNTATCSTINKYGDDGAAATGVTALEPGDSISTTVTLTNTGSGDAATFTLTPGACSATYHSGTNSGQAPAPLDDLCSQLTVAVSCDDAGAVNVLSVAAVALGTFSGAQTITGGLGSGDAVDCTFTVALPAATAANYGGQTVAQDLVWRISVV